MLVDTEMERYYPQLISRILLYLRKHRFREGGILKEDLIGKFNKSKSIISQALTQLSRNACIERIYVDTISNHGSRHKIILTHAGLEIADALLSEGLTPFPEGE